MIRADFSLAQVLPTCKSESQQAGEGTIRTKPFLIERLMLAGEIRFIGGGEGERARKAGAGGGAKAWPHMACCQQCRS